MRESIKAVFIDIDGTLRSGEGEMLNYNIEVIKKVRELGHKVFINTGRSLANLPQDIDIYNDFDGAVMANGAHLVLNGETVFSEYMDKEILLKLFEVLNKIMTGFAFEGDKNVLGCTESDTFFLSNIKRIKTINDFERELEKVNYNKAVYWGTIEDKTIIENNFPDLKIIQLKSYGEIITKNTDKANGMKLIIEKLGIKKKDVIAIGDSMNDYDAMQFAGLSIAMGNAEEKVKEIADIICENCVNGGVGKVLERIFLKNFKKSVDKI